MSIHKDLITKLHYDEFMKENVQHIGNQKNIKLSEMTAGKYMLIDYLDHERSMSVHEFQEQALRGEFDE